MFAAWGRVGYNAFRKAGIAQLVERNLAKVEVESSRLFARSTFKKGKVTTFPFFCTPGATSGCRGAIAKRLCTGLQIRVGRFDSGSRLQSSPMSFPMGSTITARLRRFFLLLHS
jgi:hypothetical protein